MSKRYGHPLFYELLEEMAELHSRKNHDYAGENDPLRNFKKAEQQGIEPWRGVLLRMSDKWSRLESFAVQDTCKVNDESIEDTLMDNAIYSLLCIILRREQTEEKPVTVIDLTAEIGDQPRRPDGGVPPFRSESDKRSDQAFEITKNVKGAYCDKD